MEESKGVAVDPTWEGLFPVVQEQRHVLRSRNRVTLDAQRFAQLASWKGQIVIDGEEIAVDTATRIGTPDRSWGIRPIDEPEPAGRPADPPFEGMWWLCAPMAPAASPAARPGRRARSGGSLLSERNPLGSCWTMMTCSHTHPVACEIN